MRLDGVREARVGDLATHTAQWVASGSLRAFRRNRAAVSLPRFAR